MIQIKTTKNTTKTQIFNLVRINFPQLAISEWTSNPKRTGSIV